MSAQDSTTRTTSEPPLVTIAIPAYEEAATIEQIIRRVATLEFDKEILVVDDGSSDDTVKIVEGLTDVEGLKLLRHGRNRGKGAAVRTAIEASTGKIFLIQDADLEYSPEDIPRVLAPILEGHADVVYGTRLRGGQPQRAHLFWHYAGNRFLSLLTNVLFNTTISDMEVGYKAFKGDIIRGITLVSDDFAFEPEVTAKVLRIPDLRLYEIPISYYGRSYAEGKKITWRDGVTAIRALLRFRFSTD